jgi:hypothetical protein
MGRFADAVENELIKRLVTPKDPELRVATCDLLFAVRRRLRIKDSILEYRLRTILTTAWLMGAFEGTPFEMVRGVGWRLYPHVAEEMKRAA